MVRIQLVTENAQLLLEHKTLDLPESPVIGDFIFFGNLFTEEEIDIAKYEAGKQGLKLSGKVVERTWFLDTSDLEYKLLLTLELEDL